MTQQAFCLIGHSLVATIFRADESFPPGLGFHLGVLVLLAEFNGRVYVVLWNKVGVLVVGLRNASLRLEELEFYIDDRLNGEIFTNEGYWSRPIAERDAVYSKQSADAALYIVCKLLVHLGYFLGLGKCGPTTCITYLGMEVNSSLQAFQIPMGKRLASLH